MSSTEVSQCRKFFVASPEITRKQGFNINWGWGLDKGNFHVLFETKFN